MNHGALGARRKIDDRSEKNWVPDKGVFQANLRNLLTILNIRGTIDLNFSLKASLWLLC